MTSKTPWVREDSPLHGKTLPKNGDRKQADEFCNALRAVLRSHCSSDEVPYHVIVTLETLCRGLSESEVEITPRDFYRLLKQPEARKMYSTKIEGVLFDVLFEEVFELSSGEHNFIIRAIEQESIDSGDADRPIAEVESNGTSTGAAN